MQTLSRLAAESHLVYLKMLDYNYGSRPPSYLLISQLVEFMEFIADSQAINIDGLNPRVYSQKVVDRTLFFLYKYGGNGVSLFDAASYSALFSTIFAFLASRLERNGDKYLDLDNFYDLCKKFRKMPEGIARKYRRTLYNSAQILTALDEVGCMNPSCPDKERLMALRGLPTSSRTWQDERLIEGWGKDLKLCSA